MQERGGMRKKKGSDDWRALIPKVEVSGDTNGLRIQLATIKHIHHTPCEMPHFFKHIITTFQKLVINRNDNQPNFRPVRLFLNLQFFIFIKITYYYYGYRDDNY